MIDWTFCVHEPVLLALLLAIGGLYALRAGPGRRRLAPGEPYPAAFALRFYFGLLIAFLAVGSPLDQIGRQFLFSIQTAQQSLLIYPAAILLLLGIPSWMIDPVLSRPTVARLGRVATHPLICTLIFLLTVGAWHAPRLFTWAQQDDFAHSLQHAMILGAALFYWWPQLSPSRVLPRRSYPVQMLHQFGVIVGLTPLFAYIVFSTHILYPDYATAPRLVTDLTPGNDQLLAGVILKIGALIVGLSAISVSFYRWYREQEKSERKV